MDFIDGIYTNEDLSKMYVTRIIYDNKFYKQVMDKLFDSANAGKLKTDLIEWPKERFDHEQFYEIFVKYLGYSIYIDNFNTDLNYFNTVNTEKIPGFYMKINL